MDFGFSDTADSPADTLLAVRITTVPVAGTLTDNGVAVTAGQFVTLADIGGGKLQFTPAANANGTGYASFTFQVQDDGGIANGGVDLDPTARVMTVDVTAVNDAPVITQNGGAVGYRQQQCDHSCYAVERCRCRQLAGATGVHRQQPA